MRPEQTRSYERANSVVFLKTDEPFGGLSNMAGGFPLWVNGIHILTSEALYQACRFPHRLDVQALIIEQKSPMTAKMKSKPYRHDSRPDWDQVRVKIMRWCLRAKLAQNWRAFSELLLETGERPIVEESRKDAFWGAKATDDGNLVGMNVLGRLLMELREAVRVEERESLMSVQPLAIPDFLLGGRPIEIVTSQVPEREVESGTATVAPARGETQGSTVEQRSLFDAPAVKEAPTAVYVAVRTTSVHVADLKPYAEYKESGLPWLGQVPGHWDVSPLAGLAQLKSVVNQSERQLLSVYLQRGVVRFSDVGEKRTNATSEDLSKYQAVDPGDFVLNNQQAWRGSVGVSDYSGIVSPAYLVLALSERYSARYANLLFRDQSMVSQYLVCSKGVGTIQRNLYWPHLKRVGVVVPPPDEQAAIVRFLDWTNGRLERAIRAKRKVIALLNEQKQAIIHRAVTRGLDPSVPLKPSGIAWLGDIPQHWDVRKLKFEVTFRGGGTPSKGNPAYWNGTIPWVSPKDMKADVIRDAEDHITRRAVAESSTNLVPAGSLLMVVRSGILQRAIPVARCSREVALNQDMKALTKKGRLNLDYFVLFIRGCEKQLLRVWTKQGATVESVEHQYLANTKVPIPPPEEQQQIVERLVSETAPQTTAISRLEREIELLREYRTRLVADVVTGKLDVREAAARLPGEAPLESIVYDADLDDEAETVDEETAI